MLTLALIVVVAWLLTALAVLGLARLLGRLSAPRVAPPSDQAGARRSDNVVALLARPRNDLARSGEDAQRRAA